MIQKLVSYYSTPEDTANAVPRHLFIEIGHTDIACLVKNQESGQLTDIEWFRISSSDAGWADILHQLKLQSNIISSTFSEVHVFFSTADSVVMPAEKSGISAAEDYLALLYGESSRHEIRQENVNNQGLVIAWRIEKTLYEAIGKQFILFHPHHVFTSLLQHTLAEKKVEGFHIRTRIYSSHFTITLLKEGQLQLVRSFGYSVPEDILYHHANIKEQFTIGDTLSKLDLSGIIDSESVLFSQLSRLFGDTHIETINGSDTALFADAGYPLHYFTPFYQLTL